jgi:GT2 family glycosyltransferase
MPRLVKNSNEQFKFAKIVALVITWNRKILLEKNIMSLLNQTRKVDLIIIIDNGSSDGSLQHLKAAGLLSSDRITYLHFSENQGPAAGFVRGFKEAIKHGFDYLWVMDDDVIPDQDALQYLLEACEKNFSPPHSVGFLASLVVAPNGTVINVPELDLRRMATGYPGWNQLLGQGIVKVRASSFVSVLFPRQTIKDFGLPKKDFYMWGEDSDYTLRISQTRPCYQVGKSRVIHCRSSAAMVGAHHEKDPNRFKLLYYYYRNQFYLARCYYPAYYALNKLLMAVKAIGFVLTDRPIVASRVATILRGVIAGIFFKPQTSNVEEASSEKSGDALLERWPPLREKVNVTGVSSPDYS